MGTRAYPAALAFPPQRSNEAVVMLRILAVICPPLAKRIVRRRVLRACANPYAPFRWRG